MDLTAEVCSLLARYLLEIALSIKGMTIHCCGAYG